MPEGPFGQDKRVTFTGPAQDAPGRLFRVWAAMRVQQPDRLAAFPSVFSNFKQKLIVF